MCSVWPRALEWKVQGWLKKRNDPLMEKSSFFSLQNRSLFCNQTYLSIFLQCRSMIMVRSQRPQQEPSGGHTLAEGCWRKALKHVLASHLAGIGCHNTDTLTPSHTHTHTHSLLTLYRYQFLFLFLAFSALTGGCCCCSVRLGAVRPQETAVRVHAG